MKTIVVPTDFSPASLSAVHYAVNMAKEIDASLLLVNVYQVPLSYTDVAIVNISVDALKKGSEERLLELKQSVQHLAGPDLKIYTESRLGDTVDEIETLCKAIEPFVVVIGSKGASNLEKLVMGSTALTAIKHLTWPVIVIPPGTEYHQVRKVGLACDLSDVISSTPVDLVRNILSAFKAELHVLNVSTNPVELNPETPIESAYLESMLGSFKSVYHFVYGSDIEKAINHFAEINNLDLVIVIPKKHRLLEGLFHESVSRGVVSHTHIPVLAIHE